VPEDLNSIHDEHTLRKCLHWVVEQFERANLFYGHGTDNAWDEAVQLVLFVLKLPADSDQEVLSHPVNEQQAEQIQALTQARLTTHKPLSYLTHQAWFAGLSFYVDERVLIPRSPFAEWIQRRFSPWIDPERVSHILDIGTGSACMAIAAAKAFPDAQIDAVDISAEALAVAAMNVQEHGVESQVRLILSDCFKQLGARRYAVIISNPPYVSEEEMQTLPAEYHHEPHLALQAPHHGLAIAEQILAQAYTHLTPHGVLMMEVGNSDERLQASYPQVPFTWLEQASGGHGLFVLTADQLLEYDNYFKLYK